MVERSKPDLVNLISEPDSCSQFFKNFTSCESLYQNCPKCLEVNVEKRLICSWKLCKNKCICKLATPLVLHEIQVLVLFWVNFGLMKSPSWVQILRGQFHKRIILLKVPFTFVFNFLSTLEYAIAMWAFSTHFWVDDVTTENQNFKILR